MQLQKGLGSNVFVTSLVSVKSFFQTTKLKPSKARWNLSLHSRSAGRFNSANVWPVFQTGAVLMPDPVDMCHNEVKALFKVLCKTLYRFKKYCWSGPVRFGAEGPQCNRSVGSLFLSNYLFLDPFHQLAANSRQTCYFFFLVNFGFLRYVLGLREEIFCT